MISLKPNYNESSERIYGLDLIRCIAIVFVLIDHSLILMPEFKYKENVRNYFGTIGVELFFCLSGFLIGTILLKVLISNNSYNINTILNFWIRRWLRTLPAYWFYFFLYTLLAVILRYKEFDKFNLNSGLQSLFFVRSLFFPLAIHFEVSWSLAIEEWFYLIVPLFLFFFLKFIENRRKAFIAVMIIMIVIAVLLKSLCFGLINYGYLQSYAEHLKIDNFINRLYIGIRKIIIFRLDGTVYGVIIAYFYYYYKF
ncbi:MAG: acyltransferase, partial [Rickettsiales bacterium]